MSGKLLLPREWLTCWSIAVQYALGCFRWHRCTSTLCFSLLTVVYQEINLWHTMSCCKFTAVICTILQHRQYTAIYTILQHRQHTVICTILQYRQHTAICTILQHRQHTAICTILQHRQHTAILYLSHIVLILLCCRQLAGCMDHLLVIHDATHWTGTSFICHSSETFTLFLLSVLLSVYKRWC